MTTASATHDANGSLYADTEYCMSPCLPWIDKTTLHIKLIVWGPPGGPEPQFITTGLGLSPPSEVRKTV